MIRLLFALSVILSCLPAMAQQDVPPNAVPRLSTGGWECLYGYRRIGDHCEAIPVPINATLTVDGRGWRCDRGYQRDGRQNACIEVSIPDNATMRLQGTAWTCEYGYIRQGNICRKINVPDNAIMNVNGRDWQCIAGFIRSSGQCLKPNETATARPGTGAGTCNRGFRKQNGSCIRFTVPANAGYTPDGNDWICMPGFLRDGNSCRQPTQTEILRQQQEKELDQTIQALRISPDGGEPFSLAEFSQGCRVSQQSGVYGRFECVNTKLAIVESGCFSVASPANAGRGDIKCPSPALAPIAEHCAVAVSEGEARPVVCGSLGEKTGD